MWREYSAPTPAPTTSLNFIILNNPMHPQPNPPKKAMAFFALPFLFFFFLIFFSFSANAFPCSQYTSTQAVPTGFGAAYNTVSTQKELLVKTDCAQTQVNAEIGNGQATQYIYKYGYVWKNSKWEQIEFTPTGASYSLWLVAKAKVDVVFSAEDMLKDNYLLVYICSWTGTAWKCGCRDALCAQNFWQLQKFKYIPTACTENWTCGNWSACQNNLQTRTCTDQNKCGTATSKPAESQACTTVCTENWTCGEWNACQNSTQIRSCIDQNNCGTLSQRPLLNQSCSGTSTCQDNDGDGYDNCALGQSGDDGKAIDCNDNEKFAYPGGQETCDTIDNNCNGQTDEGCDDDKDGYCDKNLKVYRVNTMCSKTPYIEGRSGDDCDDAKGAINLGATEICGNGIDEDCSGADLACACTENWVCTDFGACLNNIQTRTCIDQNKCGTSANLPALSQACVVCANECSSAEIGCLGQNTSWSCGEAGDGDICLEKINKPCNYSGGEICNTNTGKCELINTLYSPIDYPENNQEFALGSNIFFSAYAQYGKAPYSYEWKSDKAGIIGSASYLSINSLALGMHKITLVTKDSASAEYSSSIFVIVSNNLIIGGQEDVAGGIREYYKGDTVYFSASVQGGILPYSYILSSDKDGVINSASSNNSSEREYDNTSYYFFNTNTLSEGLHSIVLLVADNGGKSAQMAWQIKINPIDVSKVKCFDYTGCDDKNICTTDVCKNPSTISATCSNTVVSTCQNNDGCCPSGCTNGNDNNCTISVNNDDSAKLLVIYNDKCATDNNKNGIKDYVEIAEYYKLKRDVPAVNMLPVYPSTEGGGCYSYYYKDVKYSSFYNEIVKTIQAKLVEVGEDKIYYFLLVGLPSSITPLDSYGTRSLDHALMTVNSIATSTDYSTGWNGNNPYFNPVAIKTQSDRHFNHSYKYGGKNIYPVVRMDNFELLNRALYGEKYIVNESGYYSGTGYVDTRYSKFTDEYLDTNYPAFSDSSSYGTGDRWMAYGKRIADRLSWNYKWQVGEQEIGESGAVFTDGSSAEKAPNAIWYEGWYNFGKYNNVFNWKVGAFACDLNSDSGTNFLKKAFVAGLTAGTGVTGEPYLTGHPRPEIFLNYMLSGYNLAESSALSYPVLRWRDITFGDPLYNPFKIKTKIKDTTLPVIAQVFSETNLSNSATTSDIIIRLSQNPVMPDVATYKVVYGLTTAYGDTLDYDEIYYIERRITLNNLNPDTLYHYKVYAKDPVGNIAQSADQTFKTSANKTILPATVTASASAQTGAAPMTVNFTASFGEVPAKFEWNFADGTTSTVQNPTHSFNKGFYKVVLRAEFVSGLSRAKELLIIAK
ncbi:MAG: Fibronectin, type III domain protein [Candidatus Falkowbacteria bacterium GW2011_GWC2_38_22]|uniref:Fibronectin, type III domain protein n=1 Tax=Candidatus Falkowbacteria bacterium GW2011_GWE1_38_31 TaxID=1618638 RepID=A0A0G0M8C9_9BACT|nr:MAG: Fibronectin, type III domain protein [Candidatus Falkowbacteria bacterium GW2011_GWF2_38_1205]KKQ61277.1 MAG: Fibronectin, type III domain protein [Candidatus Falkowbacteria bacterium GW2011_GWC2_38_22]KKQ63151.1 MAG: Fibronectin, type III domain protein [Candidatus Falkowbacteria bacterium GW2011_GWF1_38_22]KKQ65348.1 MAG: Fibronectin, type III domain protein [Candidatus Falkowbacteria bacterium GW2011_GWE2_38_254]KKQ69924.1 MAG: Fibronectin, type III domain protein [Candidatus Falkowb